MTVISVNVRHEPAEIAVVIPTVLNPGLLRAVRSVFGQQPEMRIHLLIGVDVAQGEPSLLTAIRAECPAHVTLTILELGYSTAIRHGGVHDNAYSGALRTILSFAANSRFVATLDDNDWYAPMHLALLREAIEGKAWAFSQRWLADPGTGWPICVDEWDAVGPGRGINAPTFGGFVHPSTLMVDKAACADMLHQWSNSPFPDGTGEDRLVFEALRDRPYDESPHATVFCTLNERSIDDAHHVREFSARHIAWPQNRTLIEGAASAIRNAVLQSAAGDYIAAIASAEQALAAVPTDPDALRVLAAALSKDGRADEAASRSAQADLLDFGNLPTTSAIP